MVRSATQCWVAPLQALLLALTTLTIGFTPLQTSGAVTIKCAPPATPGASASATATAMPETSPAAFPADGGELIVFAAASLADAFDHIKNELEVANPGLTITYNFAGSQVLVTQMEQGAPADVFASANLAQMNNARDKGLIEGEAPIFAQNRLVIIAPKDNPAGIQTPADLAKDGVKLDLAQEDVPVGQYARQAICQMGQEATTYGEGFVDRVAANVVSEEDNVRAIVTKVSTGEADAGVVYATDVTGESADQVQTIEIPPPVNVVATYPIATVKDGDVELAQAFIDYVLAPAGQAALEQFGFEPRP